MLNGTLTFPWPKPRWTVRRLATYIVARVLIALHGRRSADAWAWELTPMPCGLPSWSQIAQGAFASVLPWPLHHRFMASQLRTAYQQDGAAMRRWRAANPEA